MTNLIQYRLTDKPRFFLMRDVPEKPRNGLMQGVFYLLWKHYERDFKLCEEKALEIVNPEVLIHHVCTCKNCRPEECTYQGLKHNDTFSLPEDVEFEEFEEPLPEQFQSYPNQCEKLIRLLKKKEKEPVKEESQQELWKSIYIDFNDGEGWLSFSARNNEKFTIQRKQK